MLAMNASRRRPRPKLMGPSITAAASVRNVAPRDLVKPNVSNCASRKNSGVGNLRARPLPSKSAGASVRCSPYVSTNRCASVVARATLICWPSTARTTISNPSHAPGTRRPGRSLIPSASNGSLRNTACTAARSASRSNKCRTRRTMPGMARGSVLDIARCNSGFVLSAVTRIHVDASRDPITRS